MPNCPCCGQPCYMGAWVVECDTKGCQNYKPPRPTAATATPVKAVTGVPSGGLTVAMDPSGFGKNAFIFSDGEHASFIDMLTFLKLPSGSAPTWKLTVDYLKKKGVSTVTIKASLGGCRIKDGTYSIRDYEYQVNTYYP